MKDIKNKKIELALKERIITKSADNIYIRALSRLIPGGSSVDVLMQERSEQIKKQRLDAFLDECISGNLTLTEEIIQSEDFLHCYFKTAQAAINTRRQEKIRLFAQLFTATFKDNRFKKVDEFEERLAMLDDLSYREILILAIMEKYEKMNPKSANIPDMRIIDGYREPFIDEVCRSAKLPKDDLIGVFKRLERSGLYASLTHLATGFEVGNGYLTSNYYSLRNFITPIINNEL